MKAFLENIRQRISAVATSTARFYRANTTLLLSAFTVLSILLIVWARLGFTFEIGRFFAAPQQCATEGNTRCIGGDVYVVEADPEFGFFTNTLLQSCAPGTCQESGGQAQCVGVTPTAIATPTPTPTPAYSCTGNNKFCYEGPGSCPATTQNASGTCQSGICCQPGGVTQTPTPTPTGVATPTPAGNCPCGAGSWGDNGVTVCKISGNIDMTQRCTTVAPGTQASVTVAVCNNSAEHIYSKEALFFQNQKTCGAHAANPGHPAVSGDTELDPGEVGQITYSFNVGDCGSWQLDDTWGPGNFSFVVGQVINTDVNCSIPTPTPTPSTSVSPTPSTSVSPTPSTSVSPTPSTSVSPTPSESVSPTPTPEFSCEPTSQSTRRGRYVTVNAVGALGTLSWDAPDAEQRDGTCRNTEECDVRYNSTGTFPVTVIDTREGGEVSATCEVRVTSGSGGGGSPDLELVKSVRVYPDGYEQEKVTVSPGATVEFVLRIYNDGNRTASDVIVRDELPPRLSYIPGSTTVNGTRAPDGIIAQGVNLGDVPAGSSVTVRFRALVAPATSFTALTTILTNTGYARADGITEISDVAHVSVEKIGSVTQVPTGPGETLVAALLVSAIMTLLYVSYTHTSSYRRREIDSIARQRDPLDFRS